MKVEEFEELPSGKRGVTFRANFAELDIMRGLADVALQHTPKCQQTARTINILRNISKEINYAIKYSDKAKEELNNK